MRNDINLDPDDPFIKKITDLPTLSPVAQKINEVMANPDVSAKDIVNILKLDPAITGRVLRLANSAYIGMPRAVSSLQNAVVILGQLRIYSLVLSASIFSSFKNRYLLEFDSFRFWKHSMTVAMVCESIAHYLKRYDPIETGDVFCAGILHDIGKLVLAAYKPEKIDLAYKRAKENKTPFFINEDQKLSHSRIGASVAEHWKFPQSLVNAILFHHDPMHTEDFKKIISIVHVADIMVHIMGLNTVSEEIPPEIDNDAVSEIGLAPERLRVIALDALENEKKVESLIDFFS